MTLKSVLIASVVAVVGLLYASVIIGIVMIAVHFVMKFW